jgi:hypothetical protein
VDIARTGRIPEEWHIASSDPAGIDSFVEQAVGATCGNLYGGVIAVGMGRVTRPGGLVLVQMASTTGVRSWRQQARRGFRVPQRFEVRYWWPWRLRRAFEEWIGPTTMEADAFLSLNAQATDLDLLRPAGRLIVRISCALVAASRTIPILRWIADSVWLRAVPRHHSQT